MVTKEEAEKRLESTYNWISNDKSRSADVRKWCITVWVACLAISVSEKVLLSSSQKLLLPIMPVIVFWLLDGFYHSFIIMHYERAMKIEKAIANDALNSIAPIDYFIIAPYRRVGAREKTKYLIKSTFLLETVTFFYLLLFAASLFFLLIL